jgi:hypothetical protein
VSAQIGNIVSELNERAVAYARQGLSIEDAIRQAVIDYRGHLKGAGYRILSEDEIERHSRLKFFEPLRERKP